MNGEREALRALSYMRNEGLSLTRAAKRVGLTRKEALEHIRPYVFKRRERWHPTEYDRRVRVMRFLDSKGVIPIEVKDSRTARKVGRYWTAVDRYLKTGDDSLLDPFRSASFQSNGETFEYITDLQLLQRLGNAGQVQFEEIYALTGRQA